MTHAEARETFVGLDKARLSWLGNIGLRHVFLHPKTPGYWITCDGRGKYGTDDNDLIGWLPENPLGPPT